MDNRLRINQPIHPLKNAKQTKELEKNNKNSLKTDGSFKNLLEKNLLNNSKVKFSKHAQNRLISRNIKLSNNDLANLATGVKKAAEKGAKDSLIMVNNIAYVVSVKNKTVITAVDNDSMEEKVFTNIDSAVFMD